MNVFFNAATELNIQNRLYSAEVKRFTVDLMKADLVGKGDITTQWFVPHSNRLVRAQVIAKEEGILAGILEGDWFLSNVGLKVIKKQKDGTKLRPGMIILELFGAAHQLLSVERTLVNLLQRMSGVARATHRLAAKLPSSIKLLATRKTPWGLLDKRAVVVGGGFTHRLNLSDAVLIKNNHLTLSDDLEGDLVHVFQKAKNARFIEVEVEDELQAIHVQTIYQRSFDRYSLQGRFAMMLDNWTPAQVKKMAPRLKKAGITVEVSGNINIRNIQRYILPGVAAISSGAITNRAEAVDMSMVIDSA